MKTKVCLLISAIAFSFMISSCGNKKSSCCAGEAEAQAQTTEQVCDKKAEACCEKEAEAKCCKEAKEECCTANKEAGCDKKEACKKECPENA